MQTKSDYTERFKLTEAMLKYGGNFMQRLAMAMRSADPDNFRRILEAFPEVLLEYGPETRFYEYTHSPELTESQSWSVAKTTGPRRLLSSVITASISIVTFFTGFSIALVVSIYISSVIDRNVPAPSHKAQ